MIQDKSTELMDMLNWQTANYYYVIAAIEELRQRILPSSLSQPTTDPESTHESKILTSNKPEFHLERLCQVFGLSAFERDVILIAVGFELVADFAKTCAQALGNDSVQLNFGLILALLPGANWQALSSQSPLRRWHLLEFGEGRSLFTKPLRIAEVILQYLLGVHTREERLASLLTLFLANRKTEFFNLKVSKCITELWKQADQGQKPVLLHLTGDDSDSLCNIISHTCEKLGFPLYVLDVHALPTEGHELNIMLHLLMRETALYPDRVYLLEYDASATDKLRALAQVVQWLPANCVLVGQEPLTGIHYPLTTLSVQSLNSQEQLELWKQALGDNHSIEPETLNQITAQFNLKASQIHQVIHALNTDLNNTDPRSLWEHCRHYLRRKAQDLVQVIEPKASWRDLSLPSAQIQMLQTLTLQIKQRTQVYQQWGFAEKNTRGLGICALFAGPSGTGKTLAAEVIAHELGLDVYQVDLSTVVSKYIGETEKHLRAIFESAEASGAVLLFDEADALFGKRTEVKDSHDRYANLGVSYLLQRMEAYRGLSILTTNLKSAIDEAFLRRIRFIVQFPFPDQGQRAQIWKNIFPSQTPAQSLDVQKLARLNLTGGHIRNIALNAAFLAADDQQPVTMAHLLRATQSEYMKLEKTLTDNEVKDWL